MGLAGAGVLLLAGGCAHPKAKPNYLFYPAPPDEPRLQYLTGFSADSDVFKKGGFAKFILGSSVTYKPLGKPYGIATRRNAVFVCDSTFPAVEIFKLDKQAMDYLAPKGQGRMQTPINVAADAFGNLYVTDTDREQVLIFGPDAAYLGAMGRKDEMKPCGLAMAGTELYVTDLKNHQVRVYRASDRTLLRSFPKETGDAKGKLYSPTNVAVDQQGRVYVADTGAFCIQVYGADGNYLRTIGRQGVGPGRFARPRGIAVDHEGRIYVADAATQVVQVFDNEGRLLIFFGDPSITGPGSTNLPAGVAVDYENAHYFQKFAAPGYQVEYLIWLTNQYGDPRVSVYGFLKKQ